MRSNKRWTGGYGSLLAALAVLGSGCGGVAPHPGELESVAETVNDASGSDGSSSSTGPLSGSEKRRLERGESGAALLDLREADEPIRVPNRSFKSWSELFQFAQAELNAEPIRDASGAVVGVRGSTVVLGKPRFVDESSKTAYQADDFVAAFLGGAAGELEVAGERVRVAGQVGVRESGIEGVGQQVAALAPAKQEACNTGGDCISGESWVSHYYGFYHSVGTKTKQTKGGYRNVYGLCCYPNFRKVSVGGRTMCRSRPELYQGKPLFGLPTIDVEPYRCVTRKIRSNYLYVRAWLWGQRGSTPVFNREWEREASNTSEVRRSEWAVGVPTIDFGYLAQIKGICSYHYGSRGGVTRTSKGKASETGCQSL